MNAKELYTKQMNDFCEENCKLTATDILAQAGKCTNESGIQTPANIYFLISMLAKTTEASSYFIS